MSFQAIRSRVTAFLRTERGERWQKGIRTILVVGIVGWLAYQLVGIGWRDVWAARPRTPWFYVLWAALYFQLPFIEAFIYRALWGLSVRESLSPLFRKRVLNQDVVSYSGEAYLFAWARRRLPLSDGAIGGAIKDNAIASSFGSWAAAGLLVGGLLLSGQLALTDLLSVSDPLYVAGGMVLVAVLAGLAVFFRQTLFTLSPRAVGGLFGVHLGRFLVLNYVLRVLQWYAVLPDTPLGIWVIMLAVLTLVNRLPLLPAKELLGIGAILGMSDLLAGSEAAIAAMLLMHSALTKAANFSLFAGLHLIAGEELPEEAHVPEPDEEIGSKPKEQREAAEAARTKTEIALAEEKASSGEHA